MPPPTPHVDACQIERGPEFIDRAIREVAIEGLVGFRSVWPTLEGFKTGVLLQLGIVRAPPNFPVPSSLISSIRARKNKTVRCKDLFFFVSDHCVFTSRRLLSRFSLMSVSSSVPALSYSPRVAAGVGAFFSSLPEWRCLLRRPTVIIVLFCKEYPDVGNASL